MKNFTDCINEAVSACDLFYLNEVVRKGKRSPFKSKPFVFWFFVLWGSLMGVCFLGSSEMGGAIQKIIPYFMIIWIVGFIALFVSVSTFVQQQPDEITSEFWHKLADAAHLHYREWSQDMEHLQGVLLARQYGFAFEDYWKLHKNFWAEQDGIVINISSLKWITSVAKAGGSQRELSAQYAFLFACHLRSPVKGTTILVSDSLKSKAQGWKGGFNRIKLEWLEFEEVFDLFSTDEHEARVIMAPDVMATLYDFYKAIDNPSLCFIFHGDMISCFYEADISGNLLEEENFKCFFCNLYLLRYMPMFLKYKLLPSAWQEKEHLEERKQERSLSSPTYIPVNKPDSRGITLIMYSILDNDIKNFERYLQEPYLDVNQSFKENGNTLLHLAAANNRVDMVAQLLKHSEIKADAENKDGKTALDLARSRGHTEVVHLLERGG